jgi:5-methylcytosine-specific restriction endonuclease McrA
MRKPTKTSLRRKLDKLCSQIVRARGCCEHCGKKINLQCCHIFGRTYNSTRWDLDNLLCLCPNCHINFAHKNPILFVEWVKAHLGRDKYNLLKEKHNQITKYTLEDLKTKLKILEEIK